MTCKDCVHYVICNEYKHTVPDYMECFDFKNKANVLEIPDTDIIYTKDKWLVLNMESEDLGAAIKYTIDYCTKNAKANGVGYIDD